ncbi:BLOC-2 complex member HPS3 isoform X2 [Amia ocellicauda]|uniref:BLOC-2 complex member HPS3 isoform X2 n=1 Tax=Amia ocellicauda TaxID=2972642 RepID=UPI0034644DF2
MVHVYNCHPFASQQIVPTEQEPGLFCCGGDALFVVSAGGCKIEAFLIAEEGCRLICRIATMGNVQSIAHSQIGDYVVTIEEKNNATYLRVYTNWRYQSAEKTRVGVRLLGHLLRGSSFRAAPKEQMEIIEMPLFEPPLCVSCCGVSGDLLVGCTQSSVIFTLKRRVLSEQQYALDFERFLILHTDGWTPTQVAFCAGYVALQRDLDVLVVRLDRLEPCPSSQHQHTLALEDVVIACKEEGQPGVRREGNSAVAPAQDPEDFYVFPKLQELLGEEARDCGISVTLEQTGIEREPREELGISYVLYRRFAPDFFQGCSVEETCLHSLQLLPVFTASSNQEVSCEEKQREPVSIFCYFSLPSMGYIYSLKNTVELVSTYQYPEKAQQAVLSNHFLHIITRNALMCFTVRVSAVVARAEDPYIDTTIKACPPSTMEVCALRIQLFIGLKALCHVRNHVFLLTAADLESEEDTARATKRAQELKDQKTLAGIFLAVGLERSSTPGLERFLSRSLLSKKAATPKQTEPADGGHGWNLYVVNTVSTIQLYREMVEYSKKYESSSPRSHSCKHLLSEAHLLLRATLQEPEERGPAEQDELQDAFLDSCAQMADCYSRSDERDCHLALPYYKMSSLLVTEIINRNVAFGGGTETFGKGFLFFLKHSLYEETMEELSQETADKVLDIFSTVEPSQLPHVVCSPFMKNATSAAAYSHLQHLEASLPAVIVTLCKAAVALKMGDLALYRQEMDRHAEMLQVYGFLEEPRLLLHRQGKAAVPTALAQHLSDMQDGLLVAAMVALHENSKLKLEEADSFFQELCREGSSQAESGPQLLVDFWEALLVASSQGAVIQELLFRLASVYIDRIARRERSGIKPLKTAEDLINSCSHYGLLFPWVNVITPPQFNLTHDYQEDLQKLQALLCGPSLDVSSIFPLLEQLSDSDGVGLGVHVLCATKLGQHERCIDSLLDRCPEAIVPYANHELLQDRMVLWWQKLLPELCKRTKSTGTDNTVLLSSLKETLVVVAMELSPLEFLKLLPDDGTAAFFLPHLLHCAQKSITA